MFENFPYTDMHQLNLDWIIKIAKDFLNQYTHIQQLISDGEASLIEKTENGVTVLEEKATELTGLLDEWYNTHSEDIADQLADALQDLNDWYNTHQGYLDQYVTDSIAEFQTAALARAQAAIASIPSDYTDFYNSFIGISITDAWMTTNNYTNCRDIPAGVYAMYMNTAGSYGFPANLGQSFVFRATAPQPTGSAHYRFKLIAAFGNNGYAYYAVWGGGNNPTWHEIDEKTVTTMINNMHGVPLTDDNFTTFLDIPAGRYLMTLSAMGALGFPVSLGRSFYLDVTNAQSGYTYKTLIAYSNTHQAYFTMGQNNTTPENLPLWVSMAMSGGNFTEDDRDGVGYTSFLQLPSGVYNILLNESGAKQFPIELGLSFVLEVTNPHNTSDLGYKTYKAYANNGNALYCICGTRTSISNPPEWYKLTINSVISGFTKKPLFDKPLGSCKLLLLGDSITRGAGASGLSGSEEFTTSLGTQTIYTSGNSWAVKLTTYLNTQYPNIEVINHGWSGITIGQLAANIAEFVPDGVTHCILGLGVNSEGSTSFDASIKTIVKYLEARNITILPWTSWVGTHPNMTNINTPGRVQAALIHAYQNVGYNPVCVYSEAMDYLDEHNLTPMDVLTVSGVDEYVHPNDAGHKLLYEIVRKGFGF